MSQTTTLPFIEHSEIGPGLTLRQKRAVRSQAARHSWASNRDASSDKKEKRRGKAQKSKHVTITLDVSESSSSASSSLQVENDTTPVLHQPPGTLSRTPQSTESPTTIPRSLDVCDSLFSKPYMPLLFDHYLNNLVAHIPELDLAADTCLLRTVWFPMAINSPCASHVLALTAAGHYASNVQRTASSATELLSLKQSTLNLLQTALQGSDLLPDAVISTVAKLASYEAMFGSPELFDLHMKGLTKMVQLRGGLLSLGLDGLLARMIVWIDRNSAFIIGGGRDVYFPHTAYLSGGLIEPNPSHFLGAY